MTDRQATISFVISGLPYKAEPIVLNPGDKLNVDQVIKRFAGFPPINQEDADNICAHPEQVPAELRGHMLITHYTHPNGDGYHLFIRVRPNGTVMQDLLDGNRECSPRYVRVLVRG